MVNGVVSARNCLYRVLVSLMTQVTMKFKALAMGVVVRSTPLCINQLTNAFSILCEHGRSVAGHVVLMVLYLTTLCRGLCEVKLVCKQMLLLVIINLIVH